METLSSQRTVGECGSRSEEIPLREQVLQKLDMGLSVWQAQAALRLGSTAIQQRFPDIFEGYIKKRRVSCLLNRVRIVEFWVANGYCQQRKVAKYLNIDEAYVSRVLSTYLPTPPAERAIITLKSKV